ncbi:glycerophosphodiester phosphodiesterase family protein [Cyclobacterium sp. 1_MG-2023]|uniref:glycerophosphodiester phosphodiesterase n=1 Tax=Cyclobacterium sp. 1_MG-2023 TaxID=3062681 RepID=UPI0026E4241D|nr:glycerophosphodiester phosphodiesterase family protein [Cyclobacterium sp. 1_MG-2023]MDO6436921.1 glycerophosphodiester phosphodiesterase family protein [Cyclobacterium sp. 1_MG-2023]
MISKISFKVEFDCSILGLIILALMLNPFMLHKSMGQNIEMPIKGFCAHRGAMTSHPENTIPAFEQSIASGAQMIEFDVQFSKDSALIIMHDGTLDRTTNGSGEVALMDSNEIRSLDAGSWKGEAFAGTKVPVLKEVLEMMPANIWLNVHLKGGYELGKKVAALILEMGKSHQAVMAVKADAAKGARSVSDKILICNMERQSGGLDYVEGTIAMKANFIQLKGPVTEDFQKYTKSLDEKGIGVNYFGTDDPAVFKQLFDLGIAFPLVNDIVTAMQYADEFGIKPVVPSYSALKKP